jgi:carbazole 1,9a-dioxygenase
MVDVQDDVSGSEALLQQGLADVGVSVDAKRRTTPWPRYMQAELGLRNYWYPIFFSNELEEGATRAETVLGERLFFKRVNGVVWAVEDRCLHRGVAFSARPECYSENTITCWLHGFTFDVRDGKLVQVLSYPDAGVIGKVALRTYPVREMGRTVFVYIGDGEPVPYEEDMPRVLLAAERGEVRMAFHPLIRVKINGNWRSAAENAYDSIHIFGHRFSELQKRGMAYFPLGTYTSRSDRVVLDEPGRAKGLTTKRQWANSSMTWECEVEGVLVQAEGSPQIRAQAERLDGMVVQDEGKEIDFSDLTKVQNLPAVMYLPGIFEVNGFPQYGWCHWEWYVPIDEDHHMYTILHGAIVESDEEEEAFHKKVSEEWGPLVYSTRDDIEGFNNFDAFIRSEVHHAYAREGWWGRERLTAPDIGITGWRRLVETHARGIQTRTGDFAKRPDPEPDVICYHDTPGVTR